MSLFLTYMLLLCFINCICIIAFNNLRNMEFIQETIEKFIVVSVYFCLNFLGVFGCLVYLFRS